MKDQGAIRHMGTQHPHAGSGPAASGQGELRGRPAVAGDASRRGAAQSARPCDDPKHRRERRAGHARGSSESSRARTSGTPSPPSLRASSSIPHPGSTPSSPCSRAPRSCAGPGQGAVRGRTGSHGGGGRPLPRRGRARRYRGGLRGTSHRWWIRKPPWSRTRPGCTRTPATTSCSISASPRATWNGPWRPRPTASRSACTTGATAASPWRDGAWWPWRRRSPGG